MRSSIIAALIGSAVAFAPAAQTGKVSTPLRAFAVDAVAQQSSPLGFFDPLYREKNSMPRGPVVLDSDKVQTVVADVQKSVFDFRTAVLAQASGMVSNFDPLLVFSMKVVSSIGSMKKRAKDTQIVKRKGRIYLICKSNPRLKVRQGGGKKRKHKKLR